MIVKVKKLSDIATIPQYSTEGDAGMDLVAISKNITADYVEYGTGLAVEIPKGYVGLIFPRSSISKMDLVLANSVGVIDSGYRGEIKCRFNVVQPDLIRPDLFNGLDGFPMNRSSSIYEISDKVAQLIIIPYPTVCFEVVDNLEESARGAGGFGSTN